MSPGETSVPLFDTSAKAKASHRSSWVNGWAAVASMSIASNTDIAIRVKFCCTCSANSITFSHPTLNCSTHLSSCLNAIATQLKLMSRGHGPNSGVDVPCEEAAFDWRVAIDWHVTLRRLPEATLPLATCQLMDSYVELAVPACVVGSSSRSSAPYSAIRDQAPHTLRVGMSH